MAGYLGTKAVFLSTTAADVTGNAEVGGDLTVDTDTLFVDAANNRVGIGTSSPSAELDLAGEINFSGSSTSMSSSANPRIYRSGTSGGAYPFDSFANLIIQGRADGTLRDIVFATGAAGANKTVITGGGSVGIGTTSPAVKLHVEGSSSSSGAIISLVRNTEPAIDTTLSLYSTGSAYSYAGVGANTAWFYGYPNVALGTDAAGVVSFVNNGSERARIDASGNLLVGTTDSNVANNSGSGNDGVNIHPDSVRIARTDSDMLLLNRLNSDGDIVKFLKDGTTVGSIGSQTIDGSPELYIGNAQNIGLAFEQTGTDRVLPCFGSSGAIRDAGIDLGSASARWSNLYLSGGVYLGGTGAANYLDDYEEGTFTPTLSASVVAGTYTGTTTGKYTKVGNLVHFELNISITSFSVSPNGNWTISSLPFTPIAGATSKFHLGWFGVNIDPVNHVAWQAYTSGSNIGLLFYTDNGSWVLGSTGNFAIGNGDTVNITGTYLAA